MSETIKPVTRNEAYWAAMSDDTVAPPEPQTNEECILAAMSGNYPVEDIKPQTREQGLMKKAIEATQKAMVQNVEWADEVTNPDAFDVSALESEVIELTFPKGIRAVNGGTLKNYTKLKKVTFPESLEAIYSELFSGCACRATIEEIVLPEGLKTCTSCTFECFTALASISIPSTLKALDDYLFAECTALKTVNIPEGVASIWSGTFRSCTALEQIELPSSITQIYYDTDYPDECAFAKCTNLKTITINKPENSIEGAPWGATNAEVVWNG